MKVCRYMSVREYETFKKGKTIRPLWSHVNSPDNTMEVPSVCFFAWSDDDWGETMTVNFRGREWASESYYDDPKGGYEVVFEVNSKRLTEGTGYYWGKPTPEYYMPCYNRKLVKLVKARYIEPI